MLKPLPTGVSGSSKYHDDSCSIKSFIMLVHHEPQRQNGHFGLVTATFSVPCIIMTSSRKQMRPYNISATSRVAGRTGSRSCLVWLVVTSTRTNSDRWSERVRLTAPGRAPFCCILGGRVKSQNVRLQRNVTQVTSSSLDPYIRASTIMRGKNDSGTLVSRHKHWHCQG